MQRVEAMSMGCRRVRICESDGLQKREIGVAGLVGSALEVKKKL
jgi:hypothetical protein